ncbi:MAG: acetyl-CoA carboxylase biotin carboxyl carrier protein subunit [Bacteroidales bacterium]|jgi:biotin carboxyl carrier protein|nr:acetyl-CoA carboxylase biotin carboxyl carrier protein subunit [Bacteroidales bacterium]
MAYEVSIEHRLANIELLNRVGNKALIAVDDRKYDLDIVEVENGVYSILFNGHSYNVELIEGDSSKKYIVNTFAKTFNVEIIDAETKYINNRNQGQEPEGANHVTSPMPGKVIKIPITIGETVVAGQTLIVVEAMKMQSEFKSTGEKIVHEILVREGDTVTAHQLMIKLEDKP